MKPEPCLVTLAEYELGAMPGQYLGVTGFSSAGASAERLALGTWRTMQVGLRHGQEIETTLSLISFRHVAYSATAVPWTDRMMVAKHIRVGMLLDPRSAEF
jgi:hypothetical protein